ncbi:MAG: proteasome assembly chaperone family protein [archaeon]|nr:proteasome assembly chaperone family protein [archaeon]MCP8306548.1 proteasome assembly chaperone family protein [archaeon]
MNEIEIREFKKMRLKGATVIDGLPSISLVNTIAANYLVAALDLDQIAALDSNRFPAISMIYAFKPKFPARIYASEEFKIVIFLSEFRILPNLYRPLAKALFDWTKEQNCSLIISPVEWSVESSPTVKEEPVVQGVGSTDRARERLASNEIKQLEFGAIPGISGLLLNEGRWSNFDVMSLIVPVYPDISGVKAAVKAVEVIDRLIPEIEIDIASLYQEAERIEDKLRTLRRQAKPGEAEPPVGVYR